MERAATGKFLPQPKKRRDASFYVRGLPPEVKTQFKAVCARREETMTEVVETLMRLYIGNPAGYADNVRATRHARRDGRVWTIA